MERLTIRNADGSVSQPMDLKWEEALERLAAYEDTGLDPEYFKKLFNEDIVLEFAAQVLNTTADHLRDLAKAEHEGRIRIWPQSERGTCGSCGHFKRTPGKRCGICEVRSRWTNRRGQIEENRGTFTPSQSRKACKQYVPREEAKAELDVGGNEKSAEEPEWKQRMMQTFLGGR